MIHKVVLMLLLAVVSSSAMAEWVVVVTTMQYTYHADPDTIRKKGNIVKMWVMNDFNLVQETEGYKY